jgi:branched-chain amino acid transport system permease protein
MRRCHADDKNGSWFEGSAFSMEVFLQQLINGLTLGSIYGLIAIGYTMVFGIIGMVNFAHGDIFMLRLHRPDLLHADHGGGRRCRHVHAGADRGAGAGDVLHLAVELDDRAVAYRPLRGSFRLAPLISAIGMSIFL